VRNIDWWELLFAIVSIVVPLAFIVWGISTLVGGETSWWIGVDIALGGYILGLAVGNLRK
jgi:hypothetical protein